MALTPALWADVRRDLDAARANVENAAARAETLRDAAMPSDARLDREYAVGLMLHNGYGAMESALERLIRAIDGDLPAGASFHAEIIRRAAYPVAGVRPAMIGAQTAARLQKLRSFRHALRHAYDDFDYSRAAENVPVAVEAERAFRADIEAFTAALGNAPDLSL
ncbi:ribonuclease toxin HepT-like protein [Azospirillum sp. sgz301742]